MKRCFTDFATIALLALASNPHALLAQEAVDGPQMLATTVISATRVATDPLETPNAIDLVDQQELRLERAPRTLPETLAETSSVIVQKTAHGQGSPYIRGFTAFRNLLQVDGVRLNHAAFREGPNQYWNTVDPFSASRLEVVKGPGSVLYGSDAVGGTVSVFTFDPERPVEPALYYRGGSAERSHTARAEAGHVVDVGEPGGSLLRLEGGLTLKDYGDLEGGSEVGRQEETGYDERDWDARAALMLGDAPEDGYVLLSHQSVDQNDVPRTHKTINGIDWEGLSIGSELQRDLDQNRELTTLQVRKERWYAGLSLHQHEEERDRVRGDGRRDVQGFDLDSYGAFFQLQPDEHWVLGADVYLDEVDSFRDDFNADGSFNGSKIQGPVGDDASYLTVGAYAQYKWMVRENLDVLLGGRASYAEADVDRFEDPVSGEASSLEREFDAVVGSARALWRVEDGLTAFAGVSQGFRAPNLSDLTRLDSARSNEIETPSPDVEPEHFLSTEISLKLRRGGVSGSLAAYHTRIDDLIVRTPTGREVDGDLEVTKRNAAEGEIYGIELDGKLELGSDWVARGFVAWQEGEADAFPTSAPESVREPISRLMPTTGLLALRRQFFSSRGDWWVEGAVRAAEKADRLSSRDKSDTQRIPAGGTPGYAVGDVRVGWDPTEQVSVSLAVENLADEDFRVHGSGVNEPGRNVILSTQVRF